ncbi:hypothetical protein BSZ39_03985 [Bowdeniella nasicola]|uniref:ABC-2 type transporter transmembrane domain-containing protein n=1 Tax=Bowdeniella nasicola TaxID=208480 RepID=A0A1Q5Q3Q9_9ACTO|nr:YhgE/Pip domain-containing protein [Bowdeniella nasicola]OKL54468.1 hypothetical protein BSZ39_03985 [Bowdeniella nasicola]
MKRRTLIALIAAMVLPLLASIMAIGSLSGRADRLPNVPAAVVNHDSGTLMEIEGKKQQVPLGRLIAAELLDPKDEQLRADTLNWKLESEKDAQAGLKSGKYYAVITIPEKFSENLASLGTPKATPAVIDVRSNDATSSLMGPVSNAIARAVASQVGEGMTKKLLEGIYLGFNQLGEGLDKAAGGAKELADGSGKLADGTGQSAAGARTLADNMPALADGANKLAEGAGALAGGAGQAADGVGKLGAGARALADGQDAYASGMDRFAAGQQQLAAGARQLADGTAQIRTELDKLPKDLKDLLSGETDLSELDRILAILEPLPGQIADAIDPVEAERIIREALAALEKVQPRLQHIAAQARKSAERMKEAARIMQGFNAGDLAGDVEALRDGLIGQIDGALGDIVEQCETSGASPEYCAKLAESIAKLRAAGASPEIQDLIDRLTAFAKELDPASQNLLALLNGDGTPENPGLIKLLDSLADTLVGADGVMEALKQLERIMVGTNGQPGIITMLRQTLPKLPQFYNGLLQLADATGQLADGTAASAAGANQLADGAKGLASGGRQLAGGASSAADGLRRLASGAGALDAGAGKLADGASQAADGTSRLADGLAELDGGMQQFNAGVISLADGLKTAAGEVPRYTDAEQAKMVAMGTKPVAVTDGRLNAISPATEWFPPVAPLMLFLGAIATFLVLPAVPRAARNSAISPTAATMRGLRPAAAIGAAQGFVLALLLPVFGMSAANPWLAGLALIIMGAAFAAMIQALHVIAGARLGTVIALAFLVLQAVTLGAIIPWQTAPAALHALHGVLPVGAGNQALQAAIMPSLGSVLAPLAIVVGWGLLALLATTVSMGRRQTFTTDELRAAVA